MLRSSNFSLFHLLIYASLALTSTTYANNKSEKIGDILQIALPLAAYSMNYLNNDKEGAIQFSKSFATTAVATHALKYSTQKERPNGGNFSFPSGHTSSAFSGASFIHSR